ncbi:MAG TPA: histidinol-phosphate transaminase, partial [Longimicrobiaceae bacterium]|nr:histidinol-phosphate transaminase [Longimicrobiaceae bacterium]
MSQSRRGFIRSVGLGTAGLIGSSFIIGRGREAAAFEPAGNTLLLDDDVLKISSNENARGPGPNVMRAIQEAVTPRLGRGYPPDYTADLVDTVAEYNGVAPDNVVIGTGSGGLLVAGTRAFCKDGKALVTAAPTYATPEGTARSMGVTVHAPPLDRSLALDLDAMASAATGAGLVFLCNPNNPTGTAHPAGAIEAFVRQVKARSPNTAILLDEAYRDYAVDPGVESGVALTQEFPGVFIPRTLSKAHGMAGLRVGYGVGQPATVQALSEAWNLGSMNTLSAAAAIASLKDTGHLAWERQENKRIQDYVMGAFRDMGYDGPDTNANCIFVELGRPASWFRDECL